ncbi:hypothetical protein [Brevundimonas goettingensis]|uniref:Uncharacterized protein n=1 Tax=Brevundimonas goettingensis TaxID=2774190 RepID=A0A975C4C4_9CAUL|nr:hypothetical protein [Brevundimonas goettingensis]QTC92849.1 hypothetical protein IFJ75_08405 [Brevundimonas goettingensis]
MVIQVALAIVLIQQTPPLMGLNSDVFVAPLVWEVIPRPRYPVLASSRDVTSGWATVRCRVDEGRHPRQCEVMAESTQGVGFGVAAVEGLEQGVLREGWNDSDPAKDTFQQLVRFALAN